MAAAGAAGEGAWRLMAPGFTDTTDQDTLRRPGYEERSEGGGSFGTRQKQIRLFAGVHDNIGRDIHANKHSVTVSNTRKLMFKIYILISRFTFFVSQT